MKEILSRAMQLVANHSIGEDISFILSKFTKVHLLDSTQVSLPPELSERWGGSGGSASKAGMKIQLLLDYNSGQYEKIVIQPGNVFVNRKVVLPYSM